MSEIKRIVDEAVVKAELGREILAERAADAKDKAQAAVDNAERKLADAFEEAGVQAELGREIAADKVENAVADAKDKTQAAIDNAERSVEEKIEDKKLASEEKKLEHALEKGVVVEEVEVEVVED